MSLKSILNNKIRECGYVSAEEVYKVCLEEGYKFSNAERRLRKSESPSVEAVMGTSKRGTKYIKGYKWMGQSEQKYQKVEQLFIYNVPETQRIWKL